MREPYADGEGVTRPAIAQMRMHDANAARANLRMAALMGSYLSFRGPDRSRSP
ncbi:hypothetical protein ABZ464_51865 [Streptomyces sp. NPDC005820]|uniref:hypothetical protein n=1 Tax=Streptomyces sp. NPDC005820 TaxID=3157069 RepID=UPI0033C9E531